MKIIEDALNKRFPEVTKKWRKEADAKYKQLGDNGSLHKYFDFNEPKKDASVVKRAIAGQIIAGPTGAVVGALSAVDNNNKNKSASSDNQDASVIKRGIAGQIIAGPTGAVVGALSAVDKNKKNRNNHD